MENFLRQKGTLITAGTLRHLPADSLSPSPHCPQDDLAHVAIETGITKSSIISGWRAERERNGKRLQHTGSELVGFFIYFVI